MDDDGLLGVKIVLFQHRLHETVIRSAGRLGCGIGVRPDGQIVWDWGRTTEAAATGDRRVIISIRERDGGGHQQLPPISPLLVLVKELLEPSNG